MTQSLMRAVPFNIFDALQTTSDTTSDPVGVPNRANNVLSWQTSYAVAPGAVDIRILASFDNGENYVEVDNTTVVGGDFNQLTPANYTHIKVRQASRTGATAYTTVTLLLQ